MEDEAEGSTQGTPAQVIAPPDIGVAIYAPDGHAYLQAAYAEQRREHRARLPDLIGDYPEA